MKKIFILILCLGIVPMFSATNANNLKPQKDTKIISSSRVPDNKVLDVKRTYEGPIYRKSGRQAEVLFVEDPGQSGFGPATKPDPQWTSWLDQTLSAGNYDWYGPIVDSSDGPPVSTMLNYTLVIWNCYDWWWGPPSYAPTAQAIANMQSYMDQGGKVWLIGQDINISHGGLVPTFLGPYFEVASITDDVLWNPYTANLTGEGVLSGYAWTDSSDYQANGWFSDDVIPTANGQQITFEGAFHYNVITNDFRSSFWTIDGGRIVTPEPTWVDVVDNMLTLFGLGGAGILYVDDDDDAALSGYFETSFTNLGYAYDIWVVTDSGDVTPDAAVMGTYDIVVWTTGDDYSSTFVGNDTIEVANYLAGGGKMWLSSEDILFDLGAVSWLHVASYTNDVGCDAATGVGPIMTGTSFATTGGVVSDYSDEISPDAFAWTEMQNETPVDNTIAMDITTGLPYFLFFNTFPFENIDAEADRDTMMSRIITWMAGVHDVGCSEIVSPPEGSMVPAGDYDVIGRIQNFGDYVETFDATANVYDTLDSWNVIFTATVTLTDFPVAGDSNVNFGTVTFLEDKVYYTEIYTELIDANPGNDTSAIYTNTTTFDFVWDFEDGWQGWVSTNGDTFPYAWGHLSSAYIWPDWTPPDAGDSCMWCDSDSAYIGYWLQDTALSPVFLPLPTTELLKWGIGYRHLGSQFMNVGIKYFDGAAWTAVPLKTYNANFGPVWDSADVSAYNGYDSLQVYCYFDDANGWNWFAAFDNVMINGWTGIAEGSPVKDISTFGFAPDMATLTKGHPAISYSTTAMGKVSLKIYDNTGRLIRTLVDRANEPAGTKTIHWNGADSKGRSVANGIYFIRLEAEENTATHKLILIK